ncbi:YraN family protein [bacterium]|nr:YraN family protein [bacterium]
MEKESGKIGEELASEFLQYKGYKIIDRNFKVFEGEIDIIALDNEQNELVFVEVKTRKNSNFGSPAEFVTKSKINKIKKAAFQYLSKNPFANWRIDAISILLDTNEPQIEHIENITIS